MGHWPHFLHGNFCDLCVFFSFFLPLKRFSCKTTLKLSCSSSNEYFMGDWCCLTSSFLSHSSVSFPLPTDNLPIKIKKKKNRKSFIRTSHFDPFLLLWSPFIAKMTTKIFTTLQAFLFVYFLFGFTPPFHFIMTYWQKLL